MGMKKERGQYDEYHQRARSPARLISRENADSSDYLEDGAQDQQDTVKRDSLPGHHRLRAAEIEYVVETEDDENR